MSTYGTLKASLIYTWQAHFSSVPSHYSFKAQGIVDWDRSWMPNHWFIYLSNEKVSFLWYLFALYKRRSSPKEIFEESKAISTWMGYFEAAWAIHHSIIAQLRFSQSLFGFLCTRFENEWLDKKTKRTSEGIKNLHIFHRYFRQSAPSRSFSF